MKTGKGVDVPAELHAALRRQAGALKVFEAMRPSCQRRYVEHVREAKKPETRERRLRTIPQLVLDYGKRHDLI